MNALKQDFRYAVRSFRKNPGFLVIVVALLGLGIGLNTAIFSVVDAVLLRPLPYHEPQNLLTIWGKIPKQALLQLPASPLEYMDYRQQSRSFQNLAAYGSTSFNLTGSGEPERLTGTWATATLFPLLRVPPALGRVISDAEDRPGNDRVMLLSYKLWQSRFAADPNIAGKTAVVNGQAHTIIGVMPEKFQFPDRETDAWFPMAFGADQLAEGERASHWLNVLARLKPDVTLQQASEEMRMIAKNMQKQYPDHYPSNVGWDVFVIPLQDLIVGDVRATLLVLLGAVGFVLLIACANIANLLLAKAVSREKEIAIRVALGATHKRLLQQLTMESMLLAIAGGVAGILLAGWGIDVLTAIGPKSLPRLHEVQLSGTVLAFAFLLSAFTGVLFGIAPAFHMPHLQESLTSGARTVTQSKERNRTRNMLVVCELALALVLLTGAGLMIKSLYRLHNVDPGFNTADVLTMRVSLPRSKYAEPERQRAFFRELLQRIDAAPGVKSAGLVNFLPLSGLGNQRDFSIEGRGHMLLNVEFRMVSGQYFASMGMPVLRGRSFTEQDRVSNRSDLSQIPLSKEGGSARAEGSDYVAIINQTLARTFFATGDPIGKRVKLGNIDSPFHWMTIVGVVGDVKHDGLDVPSAPELYVHYLQPPLPDFSVSSFSFAIRTEGQAPEHLTPGIRRVVWAQDRELPVYSVATTEQLVTESLGPRRFNMILMLLFAAVALALTSIGIFGVMSYIVSQRTHEIGIRIALGALKRDVLRLIVGRGISLSIIGIILGVAGSLAVTRFMRTMIYGFSTIDIVTLGAVSLLLLIVGTIASAIPALRAGRVDPVVALRQQ